MPQRAHHLFRPAASLHGGTEKSSITRGLTRDEMGRALDEVAVTRGAGRDEAGRKLDQVTVTCGKCDVTFKASVDCGAYR